MLRVLALLLALALAACASNGDPSHPIPARHVPAAQPATRLVVVLPGRGDDVAALQRARIAEAIQRAWPDADVVLTGLSLPYYLEGRAAARLRAEVLQPLRSRGYRETWLLGASMGGMGAIMYERHFPGEVDGLVLLAPYLGDEAVQREIAATGGVRNWRPGPRPPRIDRDNFSRELWRQVHEWAHAPGGTPHVWLAYGRRDRLREGIELLKPALPAAQVFERDGGHSWRVWAPASTAVLQAIEAGRR
ncbi:MAG TPA: alpha/beta hydrolase [Lysobacter sp.]|nr:alpha/beta hydrolase [Lysobacter sp.]